MVDRIENRNMKYERKNHINYKQKCMFPKNDIKTI